MTGDYLSRHQEEKFAELSLKSHKSSMNKFVIEDNDNENHEPASIDNKKKNCWLD